MLKFASKIKLLEAQEKNKIGCFKRSSL